MPLVKIGSVLILVALWKLISFAVDAEIIIPSPEKTFLEVLGLMITASFWHAVLGTVLRVVFGFLISFACGILVGVAAGYSRVVHNLVSPIIAVIKTTPVLSIILLALIWFKTDFVPVFSAFLMGFPIICGNVIEGIHNVDQRLLQMADAYRLSASDKILNIHVPSVFPYILAGSKTSMGIIWKVVVAAEVLSQPVHAIGSGLQNAKIMLETARVFAWTIVAILLGVVFEGLFARIFPRIRRNKR